MNPWTALLDPLAVRQGQRVLGDLPVPALPDGPPFGAVGDAGARRHLVVVGDDFAAGAGLAGQSETLPVLLAPAVGPDVVWQLSHRTQATIEDVHLQMIEALPARVDLAVLWVGWGDLLGRTSTADWRRELDGSLALLARRGRVVVLGCPPVSAMPRLTAPLSTVLASRAKAFDRASSLVCEQRDCSFVPLTGFSAQDFQADGVHLSAAGQRRVADRVASALRG